MKHAQATGLVIAILIAAAAAGFGAYQWLQPVRKAPVAAGVTPAPDAISAMSAEQAMSLALDDLNGTQHALADWHGKVLLVNFWATWCPPCRQEIPLLVKLQAKYAAQGLQIVGIATDEQNEQDVRTFMRQMVVNYPILMGNNQVSQIITALGGNFIGLPYSVLLDRSGRVFKIHSGELEPAEAEGLVRTALSLTVPIPPVPVTATHAN
ncbi:MAG TPA: TlpA disulfide reductase family protein [Gammaproteobacteria bacterium]|nr:TlpA disulfide reductase family protein [Gammaproteobacteria bacterium]